MIVLQLQTENDEEGKNTKQEVLVYGLFFRFNYDRQSKRKIKTFLLAKKKNRKKSYI